jgi:hypothetical protein
MKAIHADWHLEMVYTILNISFDQFDTECKTEISVVAHEFDYIPTIEVNISVHNMNTALIKIILHINVLVMYVLFQYYKHLTITPSLYRKEMHASVGTLFTETTLMCVAMLYAHYMWAYIFFNISLHNYNEFNFYEFDVDFDLHTYINKYVISIYIHMLILNITKKQTLYTILTMSITVGIINYVEIIYFVTIWLTITNNEKNAWKKIANNVKTITYLKENYIVRIHRNNK